MNINTLWFEVAIVCGITAFGSIFFGHFEEHKYLGRIWSFGFLGICILGIIYVHGFWLPRKGINGLTGEPKSKYYKLRSWERFLDKEKEKT
ncbi:MAG TPA: hypothetical protein VKC90_01640 [Chitinophagaceae bacterium]|nr:hypothetical protein [Chitinophagaceae bacterium]